jgi:hypothetical protein
VLPESTGGASASSAGEKIASVAASSEREAKPETGRQHGRLHWSKA